MPNIEISKDAFEYLQSLAKPLVDTTVSVLDRVIDENRKVKSTEGNVSSGGMEMIFNMENLPDVTFTSITTAKILNKLTRKRDWNNILEELIEICISQKIEPTEIQAALSANIQDGNSSSSGFRYVPAANFSFQGLDARRASENISRLASEFSIPVEIVLKWADSDKAAYPAQRARLVFP
ncbi:hypothetical protein MNBD_ALPHA12-1123 [hydrothermal vent metagenome]|uniref:Uncharacterized protein n=1 Tax=hydrothermal vent metagenome TaxID=652676 RepID=A0A3B0UG69_9ZZZZ